MNDVLYKKDNSREFYFLKLVEYIKCSRKPSDAVQTIESTLLKDSLNF